MLKNYIQCLIIKKLYLIRCEMIIVKIEDWMREEAKNYAEQSHDYTSRRHDFHDGGADKA